MPKGHARLLIAIAAAGAILSKGAFAKEDKASTKLMQQTATGKHYDSTVLTIRKPTATKPGAKLTPDKVEAGGENIRR